MPRQTRLTVSLVGFQRTVAAMVKARGTLIPVELNRQMLKVLTGAREGKEGKLVKGLVHEIKKATESKIKADMAATVTFAIKGRGAAFTHRLSRVLAAQALWKAGVRITRTALDAMEKKIIDARVRSRAFLAAGVLFAALDLAKSVPGNNLGNKEDIPMTTSATHKKASESDSSPATARNEKVSVFLTAEGTNKVGRPAIIRALNNARLDMIQYLGKKYGAEVARLKGRG